MATLIAVYAHISFAHISGIGWGWAGVIWCYSLIFYIPLDIIKFTVSYALSGEAWNLLFDKKVGAGVFCASVFLSKLLFSFTSTDALAQISSFVLFMSCLNRLLSLVRKIMGKKIGQLSGFFLKEACGA